MNQWFVRQGRRKHLNRAATRNNLKRMRIDEHTFMQHYPYHGGTRRSREREKGIKNLKKMTENFLKLAKEQVTRVQ